VTRAFLALGSNLGDRWTHLRSAVDGIPEIVKVSPVYETSPIGGPDDQGPYLNLVVELDTSRSPSQLLQLAHHLETGAGRVRIEVNGPRTLDVDVLLYGDETIDEPDLQVPHPRMWERRFVLQPLSDVAPDLLADGWDDDLQGEVRFAGNL
jgi:2-amino-4-hydroxy-6-hydroxymethyldihydropteridine diphosphokinase